MKAKIQKINPTSFDLEAAVSASYEAAILADETRGAFVALMRSTISACMLVSDETLEDNECSTHEELTSMYLSELVREYFDHYSESIGPAHARKFLKNRIQRPLARFTEKREAFGGVVLYFRANGERVHVSQNEQIRNKPRGATKAKANAKKQDRAFRLSEKTAAPSGGKIPESAVLTNDPESIRKQIAELFQHLGASDQTECLIDLHAMIPARQLANVAKLAKQRAASK